MSRSAPASVLFCALLAVGCTPETGNDSDDPVDTDPATDTNDTDDTDDTDVDDRESLASFEVMLADPPVVHDAIGSDITDLAAVGDVVYLTRNAPLGTVATFWRLEGADTVEIPPIDELQGLSQGFDVFEQELIIGSLRNDGGETAVYDLDGNYLRNNALPNGSRLDGTGSREIYTVAGGYLMTIPAGVGFHTVVQDNWTVSSSVSSDAFTNNVSVAVGMDATRSTVFRAGTADGGATGRVEASALTGGVLEDRWSASVAFAGAASAELFYGDVTDEHVDVAGLARPDLTGIAQGTPSMACGVSRHTLDGDPVGATLLVDLVSDLQLPHTCFDVATTADGRRYVIGWMGQDDLDGGEDVQNWVPFVLGLDPDDSIRWVERLTVAATFRQLTPLQGVRITLSDTGDLVAAVDMGDAQVAVVRWPAAVL